MQNATFEELQKMRQASNKGGALGQVTNSEAELNQMVLNQMANEGLGNAENGPGEISADPTGGALGQIPMAQQQMKQGTGRIDPRLMKLIATMGR